MQEEHDWRRAYHDGYSEEEISMYVFAYWLALDCYFDMASEAIIELGLNYAYIGSDRIFYEVEE